MQRSYFIKPFFFALLRGSTKQGYLVNWELEKEIWARALRGGLGAAPAGCGLVLTEPLFNFEACQVSTAVFI